MGLRNAFFIHVFKEFVIVEIVNVNSDEYRALRVEGLIEQRSDLVWRLNHEAARSERLRILHWIDGAKLCAGGSTILLLFLSGNHVICSVDPDHVYEIRLESHRGFEFHRGKEKTTIA